MTEDKKTDINNDIVKTETPDTAKEVNKDMVMSDISSDDSATVSNEKKAVKSTRTKVKGKKKKKKIQKNIVSGRAYISATYNNTIVTLTDQKGDVISWASAGNCGFKGPKKATPYAAQIIVKKAVDAAKEYGLKEVSVFIKGVGTGRESAARALNANGLNILSIKDMTPIPHNGCRPRKPRRV